MSNTPTPVARQSLSWRDCIEIHPAADLFPLMSADELQVLGEDIRTRGLVHPVTVYTDPDHKDWFLDGRNRLDAMERIGIKFNLWCRYPGWWELDIDPSIPCVLIDLVFTVADVDPYEFVISANIRRRHLTSERKRKLIAELLERDPSKSDNAIAKMVGSTHPTVAKVRSNCKTFNNADRTEASGRKARGRKPASNKPNPNQDKPGDVQASADTHKAAAIEDKQLRNVEAIANFLKSPATPAVPTFKAGGDYCCICLKMAHSVRMIVECVAVRQVHFPICNECVDACVAVIHENDGREVVADSADPLDIPGFLRRDAS